MLEISSTNLCINFDFEGFDIQGSLSLQAAAVGKCSLLGLACFLHQSPILWALQDQRWTWESLELFLPSEMWISRWTCELPALLHVQQLSWACWESPAHCGRNTGKLVVPVYW